MLDHLQFLLYQICITKVTLETQVEIFNTRQLFRPFGYSSVVSFLRFGAQIVWIDLLRKHFPAFRKIWSPIVKIKRVFSGLSTRTLSFTISSRVHNGTDTGS